MLLLLLACFGSATNYLLYPLSGFSYIVMGMRNFTIPFSLRRSASLVTNPAFKQGSTYTVKTKGYEKTFTLNEPFTTVR